MMNIIDRITKFRLTCDVETEQGTRHFHYGHEYVEIGGVKWATMNIGANSITDNGLYFQWGDTKGYTAAQVGRDKCFNWASYKYCNGTNHIMTKYKATDGKTVLESSDDAVTAAWGGGWRMPTTEEFQALGNAVNTVWTEDYQGIGVNGLLCTDKTDSSKVLFFPAGGYALDGRMISFYDSGLYWSNSLYSSYVSSAYLSGFGDRSTFWVDFVGRRYGFPLRGVLDK